MTNLDTCPNCGEEADQGFSRDMPPEPYFCSKCDPDPRCMNKDIEEIIEELKTLPIGVTVPFNQEMMWGEMIGLEADGWDKLENWLRTTLTTLTQHHQAEVERAVEEILHIICSDAESGKMIGLQYLSTLADMKGICKAQDFINRQTSTTPDKQTKV